MREIEPIMNLDLISGLRRLRIEDALDDCLIGEYQSAVEERASSETTLQLLCKELGIPYTDTMRAQEVELARLAELGRESARLALLRASIEQYDLDVKYTS